MTPLRRALVLLPVLTPVLAAGGAGAADDAACGAPPELLEPGAPLPATARAVSAGNLRVLVVGSASVLGPGTSVPAAAWPARLEALLAARHPGLKVETARNLDLDELAATLDAGLRRVDAAGADAVLIDPQFSRVLRANANVEPYREAMRLAAAANNAPLVRR